MTTPPSAAKYRFHDYDEYIALPRKPSKWLIEGLIPVGYTNLYAAPKAAKSFLALGICEAIVNGDKNFFQFPVHVEGPVAYLQVDTPREEWADRYTEEERKKRLSGRKHPFVTADMQDVPSFPFNLFRQPKDATQFDEAGQPLTDGAWLQSELQRIKPVLLVIDTLRDIHGMDEDKSGDMIRVLTHLKGLVGPEISILILSHSRKDNERTSYSEDDIMQSGRGSNSIAGKMDMIIRLTKKELHCKGRARGYRKYSFFQVPEGEPDEGRVMIMPDAESEQQSAMMKTINGLNDQYPDYTKHQLAMKLAAVQKISERTAYRRIDEWQRTLEIKSQQHQLQKDLSTPAADPPLHYNPATKIINWNRQR
jgi:hypothetical protein